MSFAICKYLLGLYILGVFMDCGVFGLTLSICRVLDIEMEMPQIYLGCNVVFFFCFLWLLDGLE